MQSPNQVSTGAYQTVTTHHLQGSEEPILSSERVCSSKDQLNEATKPPPHYVNIGASFGPGIPDLVAASNPIFRH